METGKIGSESRTEKKKQGGCRVYNRLQNTLNEVNPSFTAFLPTVPATIRVGARSKPRTGPPARGRKPATARVSLLAPGPSDRYNTARLDTPVVGFFPGGGATSGSLHVTRPMSCSYHKCVMGSGNYQLALTDTHAMGLQWSVSVSSVMRVVNRGVSWSSASACLL